MPSMVIRGWSPCPQYGEQPLNRAGVWSPTWSTWHPLAKDSLPKDAKEVSVEWVELTVSTCAGEKRNCIGQLHQSKQGAILAAAEVPGGCQERHELQPHCEWCRRCPLLQQKPAS
jgi:hypothetical protein